MPHILGVDDDISLRETLAYNRKCEDYSVQTVGDGKLALEAARKKLPNQVLST